MSEILDDIYQLCEEINRKHQSVEQEEVYCAISQEEIQCRLNYPEFIYKFPETPKYLEKINILKIIKNNYSLLDIKEESNEYMGYLCSQTKGGYFVIVKLIKLRNWIKEQTDLRFRKEKFHLLKKHYNLPDGWRWDKQYYLKFYFGTQKQPYLFNSDNAEYKIFKRLFEEDGNWVQIEKIKELGGDGFSARISELNKKLNNFQVKIISSKKIDGIKPSYRLTSFIN